MRQRCCPVILLGLLLCDHGFSQSPGLEKDLSELRGKLTVQLKDRGKKKVAVLDFTDLQNNSSELGRYIAAQLTVDLVVGQKDFVVVDRANLQSILAEHKLTASGLVDPENAKKLGLISGVDALVLGTITQINTNIQITVKAIATDTAEIAAAATTTIHGVTDLPGRSIENESAGAPGQKTNLQDSKVISRRFGDLNIVFESLRSLDHKTLLVNLTFQNKGAQYAIGVGVYCEASPEGGRNYVFNSADPTPPISIPLRSTLLGSDGLQFESDGADLVGIRPIRNNVESLTEISPGEEIKTAFKYRTRNRFSTVSPAFYLQAEIVVSTNLGKAYVTSSEGRSANKLPGCQIYNLVLDVPVRGK